MGKNKKEFEARLIHLNNINVNDKDSKTAKEKTKKLRTVAHNAWKDQNKRCFITDMPLKKSKMVLATFRPEDPSLFEGIDEINCLIDEKKYAKMTIAELSGIVKSYFYNLFDVPMPELKTVDLSEEDEVLVKNALSESEKEEVENLGIKQDHTEHIHDENCEHSVKE
jgi:hypothetical protein